MKVKTKETYLVKLPGADYPQVKAAIQITKNILGIVKVQIWEGGKRTFSNWAMFGDIIKASSGAVIDHVVIHDRFKEDWVTEDCLKMLGLCYVEHGNQCWQYYQAKNSLVSTHGVAFACDEHESHPDYCWYVPGLNRLVTMGYEFVKL